MHGSSFFPSLASCACSTTTKQFLGSIGQIPYLSLISECLESGLKHVQGKCTRFVPHEYMVMMQMPEFKSKHELSLLIPTNSSSELILVIQLFSDMPCVFVFFWSPCLIFYKVENYKFSSRNICKDRCIISDLHCFSRKDNKYSHFYFGKLSSCGIFIDNEDVLKVVSLVTEYLHWSFVCCCFEC